MRRDGRARARSASRITSHAGMAVRRRAAWLDGRLISAHASTLCAARKRRIPDAPAAIHWRIVVGSSRRRAAIQPKRMSAPAAQRMATVASGGISATTSRSARNVTPQTR